MKGTTNDEPPAAEKAAESRDQRNGDTGRYGDHQADPGHQAKRHEGWAGRNGQEDDRAAGPEDAAGAGQAAYAGQADRWRGPPQAGQRGHSEDPGRAVRDRQATRPPRPLENEPRPARQEAGRAV